MVESTGEDRCGAEEPAGRGVAVAVAVAGEEAFVAEEEEVSARRWGGLMLLCVSLKAGPRVRVLRPLPAPAPGLRA